MRGQVIKRVVLSAWLGGLFIVASASCAGGSSSAPEGPPAATTVSATPEVLDETGRPIPSACAEVQQNRSQEQMTRFEIGTVGFAVETSMHRTYDNRLGWLYWFKLPLYLHAVQDKTITIAAQNTASGADLLFEYGAQPRQGGPLQIHRDEVPATFFAGAGFISEMGIYQFTVTGDEGRFVGTRQLAFCPAFVAILA